MSHKETTTQQLKVKNKLNARFTSTNKIFYLGVNKGEVGPVSLWPTTAGYVLVGTGSQSNSAATSD